MTGFQYPNDEPAAAEIDRATVFRMAFEFEQWIDRSSRTLRAAALRRVCARYIVNGSPGPKEISRKLKVSMPHVYEVIREIRQKVGLAKS